MFGRQIRYLSAFAVVALLVLQTAAFAHEIEHDLEQHDEPTCALHLYTGQAGKTAASDLGLPVAVTSTFYTVIPSPRAPQTQFVAGYRGRAPPLLTIS
jgi:hypothetical protein